MLTKEELPECPVATTVSLIGSKWKLLIIRNLLERPWRFNELKKNLEGIRQKVLTDSLRSMENDGLIIRTIYPEVPPRVEYSLSELGLTLKPILDSMVEWGNAYKKNVGRIFNGSNIKKTPSLYIKISFTYTKEGDTKNSLYYEFFYLSVLNNVCDWFPWSFWLGLHLQLQRRQFLSAGCLFR